MAGRLPMPIGTHGKITTVELTPPGTKRGEMIWEARTRFRDADGASRRVKRTGRSKNAAETNLKAALLERQHNAAVDLTGASRLSEAAARWLAARRADVSTGDLGPRSVDEYESVLNLHVLPALGELRLREVTTARCEAWMQALRKHKGPSTCQKSRSVLSGILGYAARMGAITGNPIRDISPVPSGRKRKPRSMTAAERTAWLEWIGHPCRREAAARRRAGAPADDVVGRADRRCDRGPRPRRHHAPDARHRRPDRRGHGHRLGRGRPPGRHRRDLLAHRAGASTCSCAGASPRRARRPSSRTPTAGGGTRTW
jgi:hypothetical protein